MARNRVIYQSEALYVSSGLSSTASGQHAQLERVQSANYNFSISRQDINQYGQLARIDSIVLEPPTVGLDFTYYLTDGFNERALGFYVQTGSLGQGNFPSGHMQNQSGQNFYITTVAEGSDATGIASSGVGGLSSTIGVGNAFLSNYSLELAVGSLPTVSVSMEASNINSDTAFAFTGVGFTGAISGVSSPAISPENGTSLGLIAVLKPANTGASLISALRPGDITIDISAFDTGVISDLSGSSEAIHIQSASLAIPLSRTALQRLGSKFAYARAVDFPVKATLSVSAILNETSAVDLSNIINDSTKKSITLTLKGPDGTTNRMIWTLKGCTLDSESFSSSIGSNKSVELSFSTQIGGPNDLVNGVFLSGANSSVVFN
jgi:hypothetical protein